MRPIVQGTGSRAAGWAGATGALDGAAAGALLVAVGAAAAGFAGGAAAGAEQAARSAANATSSKRGKEDERTAHLRRGNGSARQPAGTGSPSTRTSVRLVAPRAADEITRGTTPRVFSGL